MTDQRLHDLYREQGQSPWLDNLKRGWITGGELAALGRATASAASRRTRRSSRRRSRVGHDYDEQFARARSAPAHSVEDAYWDARHQRHPGRRSRILRPVYDESDGVDGFVSVEVAPSLARDTAGTIAARPARCTSASTSPTCT